MDNFPLVKYVDLLSPQSRETMNQKVVEIMESDLNNAILHSAVHLIPKYLANTLRILEARILCTQIYREDIQKLHNNGQIPVDDYRAERDKVMKFESKQRYESVIIRLEDRALTQDMASELSDERGMAESYMFAMQMRKDATTGNQQRLEYIKGNSTNTIIEVICDPAHEEREGELFCSVLGWRPQSEVEIVHIVPEHMDEVSLAHIFGAKVKPATDERNALLLHHDIASKLKSGDLVIVPTENNRKDDDYDAHDNFGWRCILTNESLKTEKAMDSLTWGDLHEKRLKWVGILRPAKRYLFFRFFMTYLKQKWIGNISFAKAVEDRVIAWPHAGDYIRSSFSHVVMNIAFNEFVPALSDSAFCDSGEMCVPDPECLQSYNERDAVWLLDVLNLLDN
ncbi:hypothetical protein FQN54_004588 [Arachnomyces sp. PD_36]|nr:hypothetical protein FQN54_004588 [Arachnomyces sp. PD_36]